MFVETCPMAPAPGLSQPSTRWHGSLTSTQPTGLALDRLRLALDRLRLALDRLRLALDRLRLALDRP